MFLDTDALGSGQTIGRRKKMSQTILNMHFKYGSTQ